MLAKYSVEPKEVPIYGEEWLEKRGQTIAQAKAAVPNLQTYRKGAGEKIPDWGLLAGMNPRETAEITELIGKMRDERGYTILVIEHDMKLVKGVSDRVIAMDYGRKIAEGTYQQVATDERVVEAYLGRTSETE
jgi:ABC-type antimicrobial peptide transport system ATPase subunit